MIKPGELLQLYTFYELPGFVAKLSDLAGDDALAKAVESIKRMQKGATK